MKRARGFTLLEMMLALTLLSMITVAIIAAMRTLGNTSTTLEQVTERVDEVRAVSEFLRSSLTASMPVLILGRSEGEDMRTTIGTYFLGDTEQLIWVAPLVAGVGRGGAFIMHLAHVEGRLELRWHPYERESLAVDWAALKPRVLLDSVEKFEVGYRATYWDEWVPDWPVNQRLPVAVRLNILTAGRYWPELVIRLNGASLNLR